MEVNISDTKGKENLIEVEILNAYLKQYKNALSETQAEYLLAKAKIIVLNKKLERLLKIEKESIKISEENKRLKEIIDNFEQQNK